MSFFITQLLLASVLLGAHASLDGAPPGAHLSRRKPYLPARETLIRGLLGKRQDCDAGESDCQDGCCPIGYVSDDSRSMYMFILSTRFFCDPPGCCPDGEVCSGPPTGCADSTSTDCGDFCCGAFVRVPTCLALCLTSRPKRLVRPAVRLISGREVDGCLRLSFVRR